MRIYLCLLLITFSFELEASVPAHSGKIELEQLEELIQKPAHVQKDEYETFHEFEQRRKALAEATPPPRKKEFFIASNFKYDADAEWYEVDTCYDLPLASDVTIGAEKTGKNAFGAEWTWREQIGTRWLLNVENCRSNQRVSFPLADAREKRDVIKLMSKYTVEEQQPTTNRRYTPPEYGTRLVDKSVDKSYLARVEKILLVDTDLNYVIKELPIQPVGWAENRKQQVRENPSPIHTVKPLYPRRAQTRGIQGQVVVEFDIAENGTVKYPRVHVASPPGVFNRAAINAVSKYRYDPLIVNLEPIEVENVRETVFFDLNN